MRAWTAGKSCPIEVIHIPYEHLHLLGQGELGPRFESSALDSQAFCAKR